MEKLGTTAGFKNSYSYDRLIGLLVRMVMQPERCIVLGGTWRTPVAEGLQSKTFISDQKEEGTFNEASFEREFRFLNSLNTMNCWKLLNRTISNRAIELDRRLNDYSFKEVNLKRD